MMTAASAISLLLLPPPLPLPLLTPPPLPPILLLWSSWHFLLPRPLLPFPPLPPPPHSGTAAFIISRFFPTMIADFIGIPHLPWVVLGLQNMANMFSHVYLVCSLTYLYPLKNHQSLACLALPHWRVPQSGVPLYLALPLQHYFNMKECSQCF